MKKGNRFVAEPGDFKPGLATAVKKIPVEKKGA